MSYELYKIPEGKMCMIHCHEGISIGYLELDEGKELEKHGRPVREHLMQVKGTCKITLFERDGEREVALNPGDTLDIPEYVPHIHSNKGGSESSITLWKFKGNIINIIDSIKQGSERLK